MAIYLITNFLIIKYIISHFLFFNFIFILDYKLYFCLKLSGVINGIPIFLASFAFPVSSSKSFSKTTNVFFETIEPSFAPINLSLS